MNNDQMNVSAQEIIDYLRTEYIKQEGYEAENTLETILKVHNLRNKIFYKKVDQIKLEWSSMYGKNGDKGVKPKHEN